MKVSLVGLFGGRGPHHSEKSYLPHISAVRSLPPSLCWTGWWLVEEFAGKMLFGGGVGS